jgi:hypothetical protein
MAQGIEYTPTDKDRHAVEMMAAAGITQEGIARVLEICVDTLAKYYRTELDTATDKAVAQVAGSLFQKAISDTHLQAASCAMFFLKTRGKWRENQTLHLGGDGEAPPVKVERRTIRPPRPPKMMSDISWIDFNLAGNPTAVPTKKEPIDFDYEPRDAFLAFHEWK